MMVVSPWSHGGWVNSQVFDHTSVIRFLENVTGVQEPNISAWRRAVCGDLTSCFDFTSFEAKPPTLPDITALVATAEAEKSLPKLPAPGPGTQPAPVQEAGTRKHRALPYQANANINIDMGTAVVTATLTNGGSAAVTANVFANNVVPLTASPVLATRGRDGRFVFDTTATGGAYDLTLHGPNGFLRSFAGTVTGGATVTASFHGHVLRLRLTNTGKTSLRFALAGNDYTTRTRTIHVSGRDHVDVDWATTDGWYDVSVTANTAKPTTYRFAGRIERS